MPDEASDAHARSPLASGGTSTAAEEPISDPLYPLGETTVPEAYGIAAGYPAFRWRLQEATDRAPAGHDLYFCPQAADEGEWPGPFMALAPDCAEAVELTNDEMIDLIGRHFVGLMLTGIFPPEGY